MSSQDYIYSYIHINPHNPFWRPCKNEVLTLKQPQQGAIVNVISQPYLTLVREINRMKESLSISQITKKTRTKTIVNAMSVYVHAWYTLRLYVHIWIYMLNKYKAGK